MIIGSDRCDYPALRQPKTTGHFQTLTSTPWGEARRGPAIAHPAHPPPRGLRARREIAADGGELQLAGAVHPHPAHDTGSAS
jgi:hypothetical protein